MSPISLNKIARKLIYFLKRPDVRNFLTYFFFILSAISCLFTYSLFTDVDLYSKSSSSSVVSIIYFDVACILILIMLGSQKILDLWSNRHKKGSRLTVRLIFLFSFCSLIPSILMTLFSAVFFHSGIDSWFNERNRTVLRESLRVAESYIDEHKKQLINDSTAISRILTYHIDRQLDLYENDIEKFDQNLNSILDDLCGIKNLSSAILMNSFFNVLAHSKYSVNLHFLNLCDDDVKKVKERSSIILKTRGEDDYDEQFIRTISCFRIDNNEYLYLIIEKKIDSAILAQAKNAKQAYDDYFNMLKERSSLEIVCMVIFLIVGIMLLVGSIVMGILYSWRIVRPVSNLIDASEAVIKGDLKARASEEGSEYEEITTLLKTFNQMVSQVQIQREDLVEINKQLDERIKFSSSVLAGVSSGVIGIDNNAIYVWNNAAEKLLGRRLSFGEHICNIIPEIETMLEQSSSNSSGFSSSSPALLSPSLSSSKSCTSSCDIEDNGDHNNSDKSNNIKNENASGSWVIQKEIAYKKEHSDLLLSVKVAHVETSSDFYNRYVITFDDLTNMVMAQKKAAWSEIARRVAHEIKNPLTPIQLSAERLRRKYSNQINSDSETFNELVEVIVRQVGDIKRLIDNFTQFSKLPDPVLRPCNIYEICKQAVFFIQNASDDVNIELIKENSDIIARVDERLFHQSIVNLVKNAVNALETTDKQPKMVRVRIKKEIASENKAEISAKKENNGTEENKTGVNYKNEEEKRNSSNKFVSKILVQVDDNGPGLPKEKIASLATPYFTLMPKGTGLGLAIVKKIIQNHGGELIFGDSDMGGARVSLEIPA